MERPSKRPTAEPQTYTAEVETKLDSLIFQGAGKTEGGVPYFVTQFGISPLAPLLDGLAKELDKPSLDPTKSIDIPLCESTNGLHFETDEYNNGRTLLHVFPHRHSLPSEESPTLLSTPPTVDLQLTTFLADIESGRVSDPVQFIRERAKTGAITTITPVWEQVLGDAFTDALQRAMNRAIGAKVQVTAKNLFTCDVALTLIKLLESDQSDFFSDTKKEHYKRALFGEKKKTPYWPIAEYDNKELNELFEDMFLESI